MRGTLKSTHLLITCLTFCLFAAAAQAAPKVTRNKASVKNTVKNKGMTYRHQPPRAEIHKWEIRTAPLAFLASWNTLDVSYRLNEHWAHGPALVHYNHAPIGGMFTPSLRGLAAGWSGTYYTKAVTRDTWYTSLHTYYEDYKLYPHASLIHYHRKGLRASSAYGYQWHWSRINMLAGLGPEFRWHGTNYIERKLDNSEVVVNNKFKPQLGLHIAFKLAVEI